MKQLGPHKKYVILAIIIQSIAVVLLGYYMFKARSAKENQNDIQPKTKTVYISPCPEILGKTETFG